MTTDQDDRRRQSAAFYAAQKGAGQDSRDANAEHNRALREVLATIIDREEFILLDIGCGRGRIARIVQDIFPRARVFGIDISAEQVERARAFVSGGVFRVANEIELPFDDGSFDYATCRMSIHHYPDMPRHLREVRRVLRPGGRYLVIDVLPAAGEQDRWLNDVFLARERDGVGDGHLKFYTEAEYRRFLADAGFVFECWKPLQHTLVMPKSGEEQVSIYRHMVETPETFRASLRFAEDDEQYQYDLPTNMICAKKTAANHA